MPLMRTIPISDTIKVAAIFEVDNKITPAWFQLPRQKAVPIEQITAVWYHTTGSAKMINFEILAAGERYCLTFNTVTLDWSLGKTVFE